MKRNSNGWDQGVYGVINTHKYIANKKPIYRSSYELEFMKFCDLNDNVLEWASEPFPIKYLLGSEYHNYWVDFYIKIKKKDGSISKFLIELKPKSQIAIPRKPKNNNRKANIRYINECQLHKKNCAKWEYAKNFARSNGMGFMLLDQKDLGLER